MTIYFISGLGADKRIFQKLIVPAYTRPIYLDWLVPQPKESLLSYAQRMAIGIDTTRPFYLVGVSFGGMIAAEIAKQLNPEKTILISSVSTINQLPWYYHFLGKLSVDKLIPASLLVLPNVFTYWLFGAEESSTKHLLKQILNNTDTRFLKWAIRAIITWRNYTEPSNVIQLNGTHDKIIPIKFTKPDFVIERGGHLMVYEQSCEISDIMKDLLTNLN